MSVYRTYAFDARWLLQPENHPHAALFKTLLKVNETRMYPATFRLYTDEEPNVRSWMTPPNVRVSIVPSTAPRRWGALRDFWWQTRDAAPRAAKDGAALFISPFYKVPLVSAVPCVNMIHDMSIFTVDREMIGDKYDTPLRRAMLWSMLRASCARAVRTVTVSNYSRSCLIRLLRLRAEQVVACYHGVECAGRGTEVAATWLELRKRYSLPEQFTLFVGANIVKKNVDRLIRAFALLPAPLRARFPLVLKSYGREQIAATSSECGVGAHVQLLQAHLTDEEMVALIGAARTLVLPSFDEGFGLPVAEALACGVPVVVSRGSALEEISKDASILVDPRSTEDIGRGLRTALEWTDQQWSDRSQRARLQAKQFSLETSANRFFDALERTADDVSS